MDLTGTSHPEPSLPEHDFGHDLVGLCVDAATAGGEVALGFFDRRDELEFASKDTGKGIGRDLVSQADRAVQATICAIVLGARPGDAFLGEEDDDTPGVHDASEIYGAPVQWVVDPIDGTSNFAAGRDEWVVSVAARGHDGQRAGAVYQPTTGSLWYSDGVRSWRGDTLLGRTPLPGLADAIVEIGGGRGEARAAWADVAGALFASSGELRRGGSAALALCQLSSGEVDAYYGPSLQVWDRAAGEVIARAAGVVLCEFESLGQVILCGAVPGADGELVTLVRDRLEARDRLNG